MRILVCGGRNFKNQSLLNATLDRLLKTWGTIDVVIEGDARGADRMAGYWARRNRIDNLKYPAAWGDLDAPGAVVRHNKQRIPYNAMAGFDRNVRMLVEGRPDLVVAFAGGKGTHHMIDQARAAGVEVMEIAG